MTNDSKRITVITETNNGGDMKADLKDRLVGRYKVGPDGLYGTRDFSGFIPPICVEAAETIAELEAQLAAANEKLKIVCAGITCVSDLINESGGVCGLHLNGDIASWESLLKGGQYEAWLLDFSVAANILQESEHE